MSLLLRRLREDASGPRSLRASQGCCRWGERRHSREGRPWESGHSEAHSAFWQTCWQTGFNHASPPAPGPVNSGNLCVCRRESFGFPDSGPEAISCLERKRVRKRIRQAQGTPVCRRLLLCSLPHPEGSPCVTSLPSGGFACPPGVPKRIHFDTERTDRNLNLYLLLCKTW